MRQLQAAGREGAELRRELGLADRATAARLADAVTVRGGDDGGGNW